MRERLSGCQLADVLPPELYARWTALKQKYIGRDAGVEKFRPMFAAQELYKRALDKSNLGSSDAVWDQVKKFAKQNKVPVLPVQVSVEVDDPKGLIKQFETTPREADVACLRTTIERIETDLPGMQQRANLCRALIHEPELLMLDEPFGALDAFTREELWCVIRDLHAAQRVTIILVTHDLREATFLADKIFVMSARPGRVLAEHRVPFARPRQLDIMYDKGFNDMVQELHGEIAQARVAA